MSKILQFKNVQLKDNAFFQVRWKILKKHRQKYIDDYVIIIFLLFIVSTIIVIS